MKTVLVLLTDGMNSGWQDKVMEAFRDLVNEGCVAFFDPRDNPEVSDKYRLIWQNADIVFGYAESSNPDLSAMCIELTGGFYNKARTIYVDGLKPESMKAPEKIKAEEDRKRHIGSLLGSVTHKTATSLAEGIDILNDEIRMAILRKATSNR
ncbi:MAG: hypothetical protein Q7S81_01485 [bacterium]|nr:hypothetical protein [bacterium]